MDNEELKGLTEIPRTTKESVDRLMGEVFYSKGSIRDRLTSIETKITIFGSIFGIVLTALCIGVAKLIFDP